MFQFDIDNYRSDLKAYLREGHDISGLPYVDKLFDKKHWTGKEGYLKKKTSSKKPTMTWSQEGFTFDDFMNNLMSRSGKNAQNDVKNAFWALILQLI